MRKLESDVAEKQTATPLLSNKFTSTLGSKTQQLRWNADQMTWCLADEDLLTPYFHPHLSIDDVVRHFNKYNEDCERFKGRKLRVYLLSLVRVDSPDCKDPWYIRVDRKYMVGSRIKRRVHDFSSIYSAITLVMEDGTIQLARVFAVVYLEWLKRPRKHVGLVEVLQKEKNTVVSIMIYFSRRYLLTLDSLCDYQS